MPVEVLETLQGNLSGGAAGTITVTTALQPSDFLILLSGLGGNAGAGAPTITGLGTWTSYPALSGLTSVGGVGIHVRTTTGVTGAGSISYTAGAYGNRYILYVVRGLTYNALDNYTIKDYAQGTVPITTTGAAYEPLMARANSFVLQVYRGGFGTVTLNHTGTVPSSGWTTDVNVVGIYNAITSAHYKPTSDTLIAPIAQASADFAEVRMILLSWGHPSTTFEGRIYEAYGEAATASPSTTDAVYGVYGEAAGTGTPKRETYAVYAEALTSIPIADTGFTGWGLAI